MASLQDRYIAAMVLSGVGDAMGYKNGEWEFCHSGEMIHTEALQLGGIENLKIKLPKWCVSDDTVMHLATARAYKKTKDKENKELLYRKLAEEYKDCMQDMVGRAPGPTSMGSCHKLKPLREKGYQIPFDPRGGGCGASMRAMCIGLQYPRPEDLDNLIADSVEAGRMTHHHPTGYLGSLASALFTSYAIQNKPVIQWGADLMKTLPLAREYVKKSGHYVKANLEAWDYFEKAWNDYLNIRNIDSGETPPIFPENYDIKARDKFYKSLSFSGWGGASGHDAPMIAYDATLGAGNSWIEICKRGILHSGDNDSTGVMAGCWFGARLGFSGVPKNHYEKLEYRDRLENAGREFFKSTQCPDYQSANSPNSVDKETGQDADRLSQSSGLTAIPESDNDEFSQESQNTEASLSQTNISESVIEEYESQTGSSDLEKETTNSLCPKEMSSQKSTSDVDSSDKVEDGQDTETLCSQSNNEQKTKSDEEEMTENNTKRAKVTEV